MSGSALKLRLIRRNDGLPPGLAPDDEVIGKIEAGIDNSLKFKLLDSFQIRLQHDTRSGLFPGLADRQYERPMTHDFIHFTINKTNISEYS